MRRRNIIHLVLLVCWLVAGSVGAHATPVSVALILSDDSAPYQEFASRFRSALGTRGPVVSVTRASDFSSTREGAEVPELFVGVGMRATEAVLRAGAGRPVLAVLVPRLAYPHLRSLAAGNAFTAIYLDQPVSRRMALISEALPDRKKVGVVLGPESAGELRALQTAAREKGLTLVSERIDQADELLPALKRVLAESEVLLAVPDPLVFNRHTAQSILLTSYRAQNPLVGYSQAYVGAGALLAVYSTPGQIAQQAAELVLQMPHNSSATLPAPQYPKYFAVGVNAQVARSMGIAIEPESVLLERLMAGGGRE